MKLKVIDRPSHCKVWFETLDLLGKYIDEASLVDIVDNLNYLAIKLQNPGSSVDPNDAIELVTLIDKHSTNLPKPKLKALYNKINTVLIGAFNRLKVELQNAKSGRDKKFLRSTVESLSKIKELHSANQDKLNGLDSNDLIDTINKIKSLLPKISNDDKTIKLVSDALDKLQS